MRGEVVGVTTPSWPTARHRLRGAINLVKDLLPNLRDNGRVERGWVGISAQEDETTPTHAPRITDVFRDSPARRRACSPATRCHHRREVRGRYRSCCGRSPSAVQARRSSWRAAQGKAVEVSVTLAERPAETAIKRWSAAGA